MTNSEKAGLPAWFVIVGLGGFVGICAGAFLFFSPGSKPASTAAAPSPTPAPSVAGTAPSSRPATTGATAQPVTYEDWTARIDSTNDDSYPAIMDGVLRVKDAELRDRVAEFLLVKWLNASRESYLEYLDQLEGSDDEGKDAWPVLVPAFVKALPQLGESAASSDDLEEAVLWMTDYYAEQNAPAALDWAKQWLLGEAQESALATIAGQLSKTSLEQGLAVVGSIKDPNSRIDAIANIGAALGEKNPQKALEWAQALKDPSEQSAAVEEVMWAMADTNPAAAAEHVKQLNDPELLQNIGSTLAEALADKDPKNAVAWAEAIPAGSAQDEAVMGALAGWAKTDPKAALNYYQAKYPKNYEAAQGIFEQWATEKPDAAADEVGRISDPTLKEHAVVGVVNGWLNADDIQAAEQWVDQLPPGRQRDMGSATLVDAMSINDPQPAWDRALGIQDAQVRQEAMLSAFSSFAQTDADSARAALGGASVSEADRKLLEPVLDSIAPVATQN